MTERIGEKINEIVSPIVPFFLTEAEVEKYPFAFYEQTVTPLNTKDGIYKFRSTAVISVVSEDFDEADDIASQIMLAIADGMHNETYSSHLTSINKDCNEGVWTIELNYILNQYK